MTSEGRRVKCAVCDKPIKLEECGGFDKEGFYHGDCLDMKIFYSGI